MVCLQIWDFESPDDDEYFGHRRRFWYIDPNASTVTCGNPRLFCIPELIEVQIHKEYHQLWRSELFADCGTGH